MSEQKAEVFEISSEACENIGRHAKFNGHPHLCVEVPDGGYTITCRTSEGKQVTFSFQPYETGGPPQCVDVQHHHDGPSVKNGNADLPIQKWIGFSVGTTAFRTGDDDENPTSLATLLIK